MPVGQSDKTPALAPSQPYFHLLSTSRLFLFPLVSLVVDCRPVGEESGRLVECFVPRNEGDVVLPEDNVSPSASSFNPGQDGGIRRRTRARAVPEDCAPQGLNASDGRERSPTSMAANSAKSSPLLLLQSETFEGFEGALVMTTVWSVPA